MGVHTAEKAVALFYEKALHKGTTSDFWVDRCRRQISEALDVLETDRAGRKTNYWFGDAISHADVAVAAAQRFIGDAHPRVIDMANFPALKAHAAKCEALPVFQTISQEFIAPA